MGGQALASGSRVSSEFSRICGGLNLDIILGGCICVCVCVCVCVRACVYGSWVSAEKSVDVWWFLADRGQGDRGGGLGGAKKHTIYREIQKFKPPKRSKHTG